jgi:hypothetical protein
MSCLTRPTKLSFLKRVSRLDAVIRALSTDLSPDVDSTQYDLDMRTGSRCFSCNPVPFLVRPSCEGRCTECGELCGLEL